MKIDDSKTCILFSTTTIIFLSTTHSLLFTRTDTLFSTDMCSDSPHTSCYHYPLTVFTAICALTTINHTHFLKQRTYFILQQSACIYLQQTTLLFLQQAKRYFIWTGTSSEMQIRRLCVSNFTMWLRTHVVYILKTQRSRIF
jgi:hypothetical protein